jgi:hypothetical protein
MTTLLFFLFFLAVSHSLYVHASYLKRIGPSRDSVFSRNASLGSNKDAVAALTAPDSYSIDWTLEGLRGSIGTSSGIIEYKALDGETDLVQASLQVCADQCDASNGCIFFQVFLLQGAVQGDVFCSLHNKVLNQVSATYNQGPQRDGTVVRSYALSKSSMTSTGGSAPNYGSPALPSGGSLVEFQPCLDLKATIPLIVNDQYDHSDRDTLYIVQHGARSNPDEYFGFLEPILGDKGILVSPAMYQINADPSPATFYQPDKHLAWQSGLPAWASGMDAVAPITGDNAIHDGKCSSFDIYDALLKYFTDKGKFPNLKNVFMIGHSGGANAIARYSQFYSANLPFTFRFVVANAANQLYATSARPELNPCPTAYQYPYQLDENSMNRYVVSRFRALGSSWEMLYKLWSMQDVVTLIGDADTAKDSTFTGTQNCESEAQGGKNRRDRNYAFWAYQNILFNQPTDVSSYYGYQQLLKSGATAILNTAGIPFNHQNCIVPDIGHKADLIFQSDCGHSTFFDPKVIPGGPARRPEVDL